MGGMGCAVALAQQGYTDIHVWESARQIGEVGAGINITPNLSRILDGWGVLDIARNEAVALKGASVMGKSGLLSLRSAVMLMFHSHT